MKSWVRHWSDTEEQNRSDNIDVGQLSRLAANTLMNQIPLNLAQNPSSRSRDTRQR